MEIVEEIKSLLAQSNIPVFGIAESSRLENAPSGYRPSDILTDAKSLLSIGTPVPRGAFQCKGRSIETVWRSHNIYYRTIDAILLRVSILIEEQGETAVPVFGCFPFNVKEKGDIWGYVSLVRMAEAAGLGKTGKNGLLFSSRYGPRLILGGIVTTATLPVVSWPHKDEKGCPEGCCVCREQCPAKAINENGNVDRVACIKHSSKTPIFSSLVGVKKHGPDEIEMLNLLTSVDDHNMNTCTQCVSMCPYT
jgi:epoxyqueuosine reductase